VEAPSTATVTGLLGRKTYPASSQDEFYPLTIYYRTLTKKELYTSLFLKDSPFELAIHICSMAITKIENVIVEGEFVEKPDIHDLPSAVITDLSAVVLHSSQFPAELHEKLTSNLDVYLDKNLQKDTWSCDVCKKRGLDKVRNCGYLGGNDKEKNKNYTDSFIIDVNGVLYTHCPIYDVDTNLLNEALTCHNMFSKGLLPEQGGVYDQTEFFVISSSIVASKMSEYEHREMEKLKAKKK
jgi:hypothetical protein